LGELDKGAVAAAHVAASAALSTQAGDDLDNKVNLVRKERIELYKLFLGKLGTATGPMKTGVHPKGTLVLPVEVPEQPLEAGLLGEHPPAGHLGDVVGSQAYLNGEAVHQSS